MIGKVVASEDIPAATQLFTPNWIVKYLVQNTLGRQWLATYPQSALRQQMEYYIEPAEQTPEVQEQLKAITPTSLNPEELTLLDPACGSGHILVEAYDLFKAIYQERGYRAKDIPALILTKEPVRPGDRRPGGAACGVRPDDEGPCRRPPHLRAGDSAARPGAGPDRRHGRRGHCGGVERLGLERGDGSRATFRDGGQPLHPSRLDYVRPKYTSLTDVTVLVNLFEHAKTFGSLIQVPPSLATRLPQIEHKCREVAGHTSRSPAGQRPTSCRSSIRPGCWPVGTIAW